MVLVLVPNRELAIQIESFVKRIASGVVGIRTALVIGGESREQQIHRLHSNSNFIIATPGRFTDIYNHDKEWSRVSRMMRNVQCFR